MYDKETSLSFIFKVIKFTAKYFLQLTKYLTTHTIFIKDVIYYLLDLYGKKYLFLLKKIIILFKLTLNSLKKNLMTKIYSKPNRRHKIIGQHQNEICYFFQKLKFMKVINGFSEQPLKSENQIIQKN